MSQNCVHLARVRQQIASPLRAVPVVLADLRQQPLEFLRIARRGLAKFRVGSISPTDLVKGLLSGLGVEASRHRRWVSAPPAIPHFDRRGVIDETIDALGERIERLRSNLRALRVRLVSGGGGEKV